MPAPMQPTSDPRALAGSLARVLPWLAYAAVLLSIVPLTKPILLPGVLTGHDASAHQTYAFLFNRALDQGQFPVRWVEGAVHGQGQPLFNHYQVGFYYLVSLVEAVGPDLSLAVKLVVAGAWVGGGFFMFLLCRPLGRLPAALAAAMFMWAPYLLVDVYVRNAYPEVTAIALGPAVLWSADGLLRTGHRRFVAGLALTSALLMISHAPAALIMAVVAGGYLIAACTVHRPAPSRIALVLFSALLGAGLAAFYLVPAIGQIDAIHSESIRTRYFDYRRHFVEPGWWFDESWGYGGTGDGSPDRMSLQIGVVQWAALAGALAALTSSRVRRSLAGRAAILLGGVLLVAAALFMMTAPSGFVWEAIAPLAYIQFLWRLLMVPTLACAVLSAVLLSAIRRRWLQAVLVLCVVVVQWEKTDRYRSAAASRDRMVEVIGDPEWTSTSSARELAFREPAYDPATVRTPNPPASSRWTAVGSADVKVLEATDTQLVLRVESKGSLTLVVNTPFYPGWKTRVDDVIVPPGIDPMSGYMNVEVPAGVHRVSAQFERDAVRAWGEGISLLSVVMLLVIAVRLQGPR